MCSLPEIRQHLELDSTIHNETQATPLTPADPILTLGDWPCEKLHIIVQFRGACAVLRCSINVGGLKHFLCYDIAVSNRIDSAASCLFDTRQRAAAASFVQVKASLPTSP